VLRTAEVVATADHFELIAPVLRPRLFSSWPSTSGRVLTPRLRLDAASHHPVAHEVLLGRLCRGDCRGEVLCPSRVRRSARRSGSAAEDSPAESPTLPIEGTHVVGADVRLVEVEVDHAGKRGTDLFGGAGQAARESARRWFSTRSLSAAACRSLRPAQRDRILPRPLGCRRGIGIGRRICGAGLPPQDAAVMTAALKPARGATIPISSCLSDQGVVEGAIRKP